MFSRLLKNFLIGLGCLLIGFGVGVILAENFQIEKSNYYWIIVITSLVLGGFFSALGIAKKVSKKEKKPVPPPLTEPFPSSEETESQTEKPFSEE